MIVFITSKLLHMLPHNCVYLTLGAIKTYSIELEVLLDESVVVCSWMSTNFVIPIVLSTASL